MVLFLITANRRLLKKEHYEASNSAKYEVDVHAGQLPLPTGVTTIINAFSNNVAPIMLKPEAATTTTTN